MRNLQFLIFLFFAFGMFEIGICAANQPFTIKVVEKPSALVAGQTHVFAIEIQNRSRAHLTLSSLFATSANLFWDNGDGSGGGTGGSFGGGSKLIIGTSYDLQTGKFECKYFHYEKDDFFTLPINGTKRLEAEVAVPEDIVASHVTVFINYESKYDGSEIGLTAWTGEAKPVRVKLPLMKKK